MSLYFNEMPKMSVTPQASASHMEIGYKLTQTMEEQQKALYTAFELVRQSRRLGLDTRSWAKKMELETRTLLHRLKNAESKEQKTRATLLQKSMWEMACWENQILTMLRTYMNQSTDLLNQLKPLNPPLTTDHLKPFQEAMLSDRRVTVDALEPLTKSVAEVTAFKLDLRHRNPDQSYEFRPAI